MNTIVQHDLQRFVSIAQADAQFAGILFGFFKAQDGIPHTVGKTGLEARFDIFQACVGRIFLPGKLTGIVEGGPAHTEAGGGIVGGGQQAFAPVAVYQPPVSIQPEGIGGLVGFENPKIGRGMNRHGVCPVLMSSE